MGLFVLSLLVFLAVAFAAFFIYSLATRSRESVRDRLNAYTLPRRSAGPGFLPSRLALGASMEQRLAEADVSLRAYEFRLILLAATGVGALVGSLFRRGLIMTVLFGAAGYLLPRLWLEFKRRGRKRRLSQQVPDALMTISHALRAGYGLTQGIQAVATDAPGPIATEFSRVLRELGLGASVEEALNGLIARTQNEDLTIAMTGVQINREVGGNLAELLDRIAETIRERVKLQNHIRVLTIQGKISGVFAGIFPAAMAIVFYIMNPRYESILFTSTIGLVAILIAVTMQIIGGLMVWRIVNIEA